MDDERLSIAVDKAIVSAVTAWSEACAKPNLAGKCRELQLEAFRAELAKHGYEIAIRALSPDAKEQI